MRLEGLLVKNEFTFADAEKAFKSYGCTSFHMSRDEPELYERYTNLNVSKEQEKTWTRESFHQLISELANSSGSNEKLWWAYSRATTLAEYLKEAPILDALEKVSVGLLKTLPASEAIMCAECILDNRNTSQRNSVIFISESLDKPDLAKKFIEHAKNFIDLYQDIDKLRSEKARTRLDQTRSMLRST